MDDTRPAAPYLVIRASAGTGKTFRLSNRFIELAAGGVALDSILATTFTRKGAGEITDRILTRLAAAACCPEKLAELRRQIGAELDGERCRALLVEMLRGLHRLRMGTLDSFFIQMARSFSLELGQPPGWQIVDEFTDARLRDEALGRVLADERSGDVVRLVNLLYKGEAVSSVRRQLSGLITGLYSLYQEAPAEAWRVPRVKPLGAAELRVALDALGAVPLPAGKRYADARAKDLANAEAGDWSALVSGGLSARVAKDDLTYYTKPIPDEIVAAYKPVVEHAKAALVEQIANQTEATWRLLERFDAAYRRLKLDRHALRFEDVTRLLGDAELTERMDEMEYRLDGRVAHLLLDEFQDTSPAQWRVLRLFARRVFDGDGQGSFFCVGDVKQAIYGWRGGVAEIFDTLEGEFPAIAREPLNTSFRSSPVVIEAVNRVFEKLAENPALGNYGVCTRRWAERFEKHATAKTDYPGYVRLATAPRAKEKEDKNLPTQLAAAAEVARLAKECAGRSIGVLVRRNQTVARMIYMLRQHHRIEASEEGGNALTDSPGVQLVLSLLRLADHPGDTIARFHVATSPLGAEVGLTAYDDDIAAARLGAEIRRRLMTEGYGPTIYGWTKALAGSCDARELARLMQLVELAYRNEGAATTRTDDFARLVGLVRLESPRAADVRVMTYHQAKGLQFDIVVLPELDCKLSGQKPELVVRRSNPAAPVELVCRYVSKETRCVLPRKYGEMFEAHETQVANESLAVLYVALTRAVYALHMVIKPSAENERNVPATLAGVVRGALVGTGSVAPETTVFELGDPAWNTRLGAAEPAAAAPTEPLVVRLAPSRGRATRGLEVATPSRLEGGPRVNLATRLRLDAEEARERGTLMHAWFEMIEWLDDGPPAEALLRQTAERLAIQGLDVPKLIKEFYAALKRPAVTAALGRASLEPGRDATSAVCAAAGPGAPRWEVHREWLFYHREGNMLLEGRIDRLVILYDGAQPVAADIIDFKTDRLPPGDAGALAARVEVYRPQMDAYRRAAAGVLRLAEEKVTARLLFVEQGTVVEVG